MFHSQRDYRDTTGRRHQRMENFSLNRSFSYHPTEVGAKARNELSLKQHPQQKPAPPIHQQRPLSNVNRSFTCFHSYRNYENKLIVVVNNNSNNNNDMPEERQFVRQSYQTILQRNCDQVIATDIPPSSGSSGRNNSNNNPLITQAEHRASPYGHRHHHVHTPSTKSDSMDGSDNDDDNGNQSFADRSSFWNEWAEELLHKEEVEYKETRVSLSPEIKESLPMAGDDKNPARVVKNMDIQSQPVETNDTAKDLSMYHEDPTIAFVEETPDNSYCQEPEVFEMHVPQPHTHTLKVSSIVPRNLDNLILPYPAALMVGSSVNSNNSIDDVEVLNDSYSKTVLEDVKSNENGSVTTTDHELQCTVTQGSDSENVTNESVAAAVVSPSQVDKCEELPPQDGNHSQENISPLKSVMSECSVNDSIVKDENEMVNVSITTLAAMNITQATVQLPPITLLQQAMEYSTLASENVQKKEYISAMEYFERAIDCYMLNQKEHFANMTEDTKTPQNNVSILCTVNIAGCYRNMGTVSRMLEKYDEVIGYLCKAEEYYIRANETVEIRRCQSIVTSDGQYLNNTIASYYTTGEDETLCLDGMIIETIQSRAYYLTKFQMDIEQAVKCHENCLKHLLHIIKVNGWTKKARSDESQVDESHTKEKETIREQGVSFVSISVDHHTSLLVKSLEALGCLYRSGNSTSIANGSMILFEDAIDVLQSRLEEDESSNESLIMSVSLILRYLSEILFERKELDKSIDALHDSAAIKLTAAGEPCPETLEVMEKMGSAHEKLENYEKALSCFEQTLFARCRFYGNTHFYVAKSLMNVARVTELKDGVSAETVELYKAANAIFALHLLSDSPPLDKEVENILQLIPTVIQQGKYDKAIADLQKCLAITDDDVNAENKFHRAQIYLDLGRAYLGKEDFELAKEALTNALSEQGEVKDEEIYALLQRVEFLQRENENHLPKPQVDAANTSVLSLSFVPDPTLSFHDVTFYLQGDRSMSVLAGNSTININKEDNQLDEVPKCKNDPLTDVLYQSFVKDHVESQVEAKTTPLTATAVHDQTPLYRRIRTKISQKVKKLIIFIRSKCRNNKHWRKLKVGTNNCLSSCKRSLSAAGKSRQQKADYNPTNQDASSSRKFSSEAVVNSSFEGSTPSKVKLAIASILSKCGLRDSDAEIGGMKRCISIPFSPSLGIHQHVVIAEEDGGFGCCLVHT